MPKAEPPATPKRSTGKRSRAKGAGGEREAAHWFRDNWPGCNAEDTQRAANQYRGGGVSPDVVGVPGWWVEVKRRKLDEGMAKHLIKASSEAKDATPLVFHRRDGDTRWLVTLWADDLAALQHRLREAESRAQGFASA